MAQFCDIATTTVVILSKENSRYPKSSKIVSESDCLQRQRFERKIGVVQARSSLRSNLALIVTKPIIPLKPFSASDGLLKLSLSLANV